MEPGSQPKAGFNCIKLHLFTFMMLVSSSVDLRFLAEFEIIKTVDTVLIILFAIIYNVDK